MEKAEGSVFIGDSREWAEEQFGRCDLGDVRRTRRVVEYAARQADNPAGSTNAVCCGDEAAAEGAYRMIRNSKINASSLENGPFNVTAGRCAERDVVLAIQDTMTLTVSTAVGESLGEIGKDGRSGRGLLVHSTLAVDGITGEPLGLLDQLRWTRSEERPGRKTRRNRAYEEKESFKWEVASRAVADRVASMSNIVTVCDREADVYEFLRHHVELEQRFVVRAMQNRVLESTAEGLWDHLFDRPVIGKYEVIIQQRGGQREQRSKGQGKRPARQQRTATMAIRVATLKLPPPRCSASDGEPIVVGVVLAKEVNCPEGTNPLEWMLLTSEPVNTKAAATTVLGYYERRWLIEEFHKVWKSGCRIEYRPVQCVDNLHRIIVITAHVAVRLLQLRSVATSQPERSCNGILSQDELQCLRAATQPGKTAKPPTVLWAVQAIAKLAGWRDTKRTGRVGWDMLWRGWMILEQRVVGWKLAQQVAL